MPDKNILDELKEKNEYPIVFIGSGISKRYLNDFPSWEELLESFWKELDNGKDFFAYLNNLRNHVKDQQPDAPDNEVMYLTNIQAGTEIEGFFNEKYFKQEIEIENFSQKQAYKSNISPFKMALSNKFGSYTIKDEHGEEFQTFKKFLNKTQIILTTNYDNLIEDSVDSINENGLKKYIGQTGFFEQTLGWAEIYKLHGSVEKPESIVISKEDYVKFDKNSILISAKIISQLITSPIIFFGYSLTDMNIRKIVRDFSSSLTQGEVSDVGSRIVIVQRGAGNNITERKIYDKSLGCEYVVITTGNFLAVYRKLLEINQGISPSEVRRYQSVIKKLIVDYGKKGSLNTLLIAPDLDGIERRLDDRNLVVALGDTTYVFRMPDLISYVYDYVFNEEAIPTDIALRYVASQGSNSRIPFLKYIKNLRIEDTNLNSSEKERMKQRISTANLENCFRTINTSCRIKKKSIAEIELLEYTENKEIEVVSYNATRIKFEELQNYIKVKVTGMKKEGVIRFSTPMRRLLLIYDLLVNKEASA